MKTACILFTVTFLLVLASSRAGRTGRQTAELQCYSCSWTDDFTSCQGIETCGGFNMKCADRYRLSTYDGIIQVNKGCRSVNWLAEQRKCRTDQQGNTLIGETCVIECDSTLCNTQTPTLVKGITDRYCKQCDWRSDVHCTSSCSCGMSEGACSTQVKFDTNGVKQYKYGCQQNHYCEGNFIAKNHGNCGATPADATGIPDGEICNYCTDNISEDNSNP
ncbi:uncharacterized protein [Ptychodera flava]|uniref:uncharacterized protein n=1 Tax=Ptychodera flava TaxID=63121 RepID=UPI00396A06C2